MSAHRCAYVLLFSVQTAKFRPVTNFRKYTLAARCHVVLLPYSWKLSREKTFANWLKIQFSRRKLSPIAHFCHAIDATPPNFAMKTFARIATNREIHESFSLESFSQKGICNKHLRAAIVWHVVCNIAYSHHVTLHGHRVK